MQVNERSWPIGDEGPTSTSPNCGLQTGRVTSPKRAVDVPISETYSGSKLVLPKRSIPPLDGTHRHRSANPVPTCRTGASGGRAGNALERTAARRLVVVGASLAGLRAAETARRNGFDGEIVLVGKEQHPPYDRPPLSKEFLIGSMADVFYHEENILREDLRLRLILGRPATALKLSARAVEVDGENEIEYDRLILATGANPRLLANIPDIPGVATLRTLDDSLHIRSLIKPGCHVLVVGGGFIGSEIASSATKLGAKATIVEAAPIPLVRALGAPVGERISELHGSNGTDLLCGVEVTEVEGDQHVTGVKLTNGGRLDVDLIIVGVGAAPATQWLTGSGLRLNPVDGGVECDKFLETSQPGVYAAGDIAQWPNPMMSMTMRLENWSSAAEQGAIAAHNALSPQQPTAYETVPYYWSDWYGHRIQFVGTPTCDEVTFYRGATSPQNFVALYRAGDRLIGAASVDGQKMIMKYRHMIREGASFETAIERFSNTLHAEIMS
jgi:NADPH-dependent 2,4-dienoyl-CoA reductase/sulfur reductase-like enzyme